MGEIRCKILFGRATIVRHCDGSLALITTLRLLEPARAVLGRVGLHIINLERGPDVMGEEGGIWALAHLPGMRGREARAAIEKSRREGGCGDLAEEGW